jgi:hypothetical protein
MKEEAKRRRSRMQETQTRTPGVCDDLRGILPKEGLLPWSVGLRPKAANRVRKPLTHEEATCCPIC